MTPQVKCPVCRIHPDDPEVRWTACQFCHSSGLVAPEDAAALTLSRLAGEDLYKVVRMTDGGYNIVRIEDGVIQDG